jgi:hypothetical protein
MTCVCTGGLARRGLRCGDRTTEPALAGTATLIFRHTGHVGADPGRARGGYDPSTEEVDKPSAGGGNGPDRHSETKGTAQTSSVALGRTADKSRRYVRDALLSTATHPRSLDCARSVLLLAFARLSFACVPRPRVPRPRRRARPAWCVVPGPGTAGPLVLPVPAPLSGVPPARAARPCDPRTRVVLTGPAHRPCRLHPPPARTVPEEPAAPAAGPTLCRASGCAGSRQWSAK